MGIINTHLNFLHIDFSDQKEKEERKKGKNILLNKYIRSIPIF